MYHIPQLRQIIRQPTFNRTRRRRVLPYRQYPVLLSRSRTRLSLYASRVPAGVPSLAEDSVERHATLDDILLQHPEQTFLLRVTGDSMQEAGIHEGDLLTVDRKLVARNGDIVVASIDGQTTVKTLEQRQAAVRLLPHNTAHQPIDVRPDSDFCILGVVTNVIRAVY